MMRDFEVYEKTSGFFFTIGAVFSKVQYLPITALRVTSNIAALLMYLLGYILWVAACRKYPHQQNLNDHWYTFAEFKSQYMAAAIIGSFAMTFSLLAILNPIAFVVSAWLMVISNFFWVIGERNKMANPPEYRECPCEKMQETNFNYTTIVFAISCITAISVTSVVLLPVSSIYIVSIATILTTGLTTWSFEHVLENWFAEKSVVYKVIPETSPALEAMCRKHPDSINQAAPVSVEIEVEMTRTKALKATERLPEHTINTDPEQATSTSQCHP